MACIYQAQNTINEKCYIGQSMRSMEHRKDWHEKQIDNPEANWSFHLALKKYGAAAFVWTVLKDDLEPDELDLYEMMYIRKLNTKLPTGYNMTDGGASRSGCQHTEATKKKMSVAAKGKPKSEEHRRKIAENVRRHWQDPEYRRQTIERMQQAAQRPEVKERRCRVNKEAQNRPEVRRKKSARNRGLTFEEIHGPEKAAEIGAKLSAALKRRTPELRRQMAVKSSQSQKGRNKGKSLEELYGVEKAAEIRQKLRKPKRKRRAKLEEITP